MVWGSFLFVIAAAALKTPTRNGYNAQGGNLTFLHESALLALFWPACIAHTVATLLHDEWAIYNPP